MAVEEPLATQEQIVFTTVAIVTAIELKPSTAIVKESIAAFVFIAG